MLRLAVWFYQVHYRVQQFLANARLQAERERNAADRKRREAKLQARFA